MWTCAARSSSYSMARSHRYVIRSGSEKMVAITFLFCIMNALGSKKGLYFAGDILTHIREKKINKLEVLPQVSISNWSALVQVIFLCQKSLYLNGWWLSSLTPVSLTHCGTEFTDVLLSQLFSVFRLPRGITNSRTMDINCVSSFTVEGSLWKETYTQYTPQNIHHLEVICLLLWSWQLPDSHGAFTHILQGFFIGTGMSYVK